MPQVGKPNNDQVSLRDAALARDGRADDGEAGEEQEDVRDGMREDESGGGDGECVGRGELLTDEGGGVVPGGVPAEDTEELMLEY